MMENTSTTEELTWLDIYNALAGTAEDPLAIAEAAEKQADEVEGFLQFWCKEDLVEPAPILLRECAAIIKAQDDSECLHRAITLTDKDTGTKAICVLMFDDPDMLGTRAYKCTPNDITGYALIVDPDQPDHDSIRKVFPYSIHISHEPETDSEKNACESIQEKCEHPIYAWYREEAARNLASHILGWLETSKAITYQVEESFGPEDFDFEVTSLTACQTSQK
jgi:hypothetical protein